MSGSGINWATCKSASRSRQRTMPAPHHSVFYRPDALPAAQPTASKHWRQRSENIGHVFKLTENNLWSTAIIHKTRIMVSKTNNWKRLQPFAWPLFSRSANLSCATFSRAFSTFSLIISTSASLSWTICSLHARIDIILGDTIGTRTPHLLKWGYSLQFLSTRRGHLLSWNCTEMRGWPRLCPRPHWGSLQHSPRPPSSIKGATSKGEGRRGGREEKVVPPTFWAKVTPLHAHSYMLQQHFIRYIVVYTVCTGICTPCSSDTLLFFE